MRSSASECGLIQENFGTYGIAVARRAIELAVVKQAHVLQPGLNGRDHDIQRVFRPVDIANLVTVVGRDRQFDNRQTGDQQLNDDFRIEMKIVGVPVERNRPQRV